MGSVNFEKKSRFWIGLFILVMSLIYVLVSWGKTDWTRWIAVVWGFFLVGFLFIEAGIIEYFRQKKYQQIGLNDFVVWVTIITGAILFLNTILLLNIIPVETVPEWLTTFLRTNGTVVGVIAGILGGFYTLTGKPKA